MALEGQERRFKEKQEQKDKGEKKRKERVSD